MKGEIYLKYYLAIDIGASSGRHIVGWREGDEIYTKEVYRFPNGVTHHDGHLVWDIECLYNSVLAGIRVAFKEYPEIESLSIDTWGVDYVLLNGDKEIYPVYAYRDSRTEAVIHKVHELIPFSELYSRVGCQFQPFNSIYQLYDDKLKGRLDKATDMLMIPEYLMYKLTGNKVKEFTNATTAGLINADTLEFDEYIFDKLGIPTDLIAPVYQPGTLVGRLTPEVEQKVGGNVDVVLCATHDTGSAVEAIEMQTDAPYISSGTWSLLGVKTPKALTDAKSRESGYSNEGGVGYNRYQKNITGMWIIQCLRAELCPDKSFVDIAKMAATSKFEGIFNVNDGAFLAPKSMKGAIDKYFAERGEKLPECAADYFNSAYLSLGYCYNEAIRDLESNTGKTYPEIYIVGGGAKNAYLNEITEKHTGKKVIALPIEATAIGNLTVQMKRYGEMI